MIKRLNRKAQREVSMGTFLLLILGVGGLLLVAWGFYQYWGVIVDPVNQLELDATLVEQKCTQLAISPSGYCNDYIEAGKNQYVNCPYAVTDLGIQLKDVDVSKIECLDAVATICQKFYLEGKDMDKTYVNTVLCSTKFSCVAKDGAENDQCGKAKSEDGCNKVKDGDSSPCEWKIQ